MTAWRALTALALAVIFSGSAAAQGSAPRPVEVGPFVGTWVFTMTDPAIFKGTQQTVRISQTDGAIAATFQVDQFPPNEVTGVFRDGSILVLTISHGARPGLVENGAPVWSVMAMTLDGDTMRMAQMLERSQTIKRGTAKKLPN